MSSMFKNKVRNILILGNLAMISLCIYVWSRSQARDNQYESIIKSYAGSSSVGYGNPRHRPQVLAQNRTFPRGGDSLTFDQPWQLAPIKIHQSFDELDKGVKYVVSNFTYSPGLGNLMFQFASLRALAAQHKATLILPSNCLLRRAFAHLTLTHNDSGVVFVRASVLDHYLEEHKGITVNDCCRYRADIKLFNADNEKDQLQVAVINGYFQSFKYFSPDFSSLIRKSFKFLHHILGAADAILENAKFKNWNNDLEKNDEQGNDIVVQLPEEFTEYYYVAVHVRHGIDLTMHSRNIKHGHVVAPGDYYSRAMQHFITKITHKKVIFVVASDDLSWARKNFVSESPGQFIFVNSGYREVDLATLTRCNASIISTGTFSWWSGWLLNHGTEVVYYKDWPAAGSELAAQVDKDDYFPKSWIPM